ncbi:MAG: blaR1 peptidase M56 family protein, partial [Bacteroidota bacterium]|nr:blaR1 peptidase M56 family protein [Bacteroidota bacterium]MDX5431552.1 blaR1 peptidase M56 family protein [Bacteroidota bacterium]MDX5470273.1 blaR1 peptidase M56 family protein [Bacteroidota bacterium]
GAFSFFGSIFLPTHLNPQDRAFVLQHEWAHVKQMHSLDRLISFVMRCVFWFNPVLYFLEKAIILNHEYLADGAVLQKEKDAESYFKTV